MKGITDIDEGTLRRVDWQELIPATILCRAFSATFKTSYLLLGATLVALFATLSAAFNDDYNSFRTSAFRCERSDPQHKNEKIKPFCKQNLEKTFLNGGEVVATALRLGAAPRRSFVFSTRRAVVDIFAIVAALWLGLAVSRTTAVRLASTSRSSTLKSLKFAARRLPALVLPIFLPIASYFVAALLVGVLRCNSGRPFLETFANCGAMIVAILLFALVVLFATTVVAFPLSATAIATEKSDGFDAVSRGVSYATQRPLHLIVYWTAAAFLTGLGLIFVAAAAATARWGYLQIFSVDLGVYSSAWTRFWSDFLTAIPVAYVGNCFVVYSVAIYIALRRSVDGTPFDQYNDDSTGRKTRRLRPILQDAQGAPTLAEKASDDAVKTVEKSSKNAENAENSENATENADKSIKNEGANDVESGK